METQLFVNLHYNDFSSISLFIWSIKYHFATLLLMNNLKQKNKIFM